MRPNWGMIGVLLGTVLIWWSIFTNGFFSTIIWLIIITAIFGLWLRLTGRG
tara:strand:- start:421 stop:573 length:153 start_codon:yes stop_codon:yes gene_type:complete